MCASGRLTSVRYKLAVSVSGRPTSKSWDRRLYGPVRSDWQRSEVVVKAKLLDKVQTVTAAFRKRAEGYTPLGVRRSPRRFTAPPRDATAGPAHTASAPTTSRTAQVGERSPADVVRRTSAEKRRSKEEKIEESGIFKKKEEKSPERFWTNSPERFRTDNPERVRINK